MRDFELIELRTEKEKDSVPPASSLDNTGLCSVIPFPIPNRFRVADAEWHIARCENEGRYIWNCGGYTLLSPCSFQALGGLRLLCSRLQRLMYRNAESYRTERPICFARKETNVETLVLESHLTVAGVTCAGLVICAYSRITPTHRGHLPLLA